MTRIERRWARALLESFAPGVATREGEVPYLPTLQEMLRRVQPHAAWGLRIAIWVAALAPLWRWRKLATVTSLARERRAVLLDELLGHPSFAVRELVLLLKLAACLALLGTEALRARSHYDDAQAETEVDSGLYRSLAPAQHVVRLRVWEPDPSPPRPVRPVREDREAS